MSSNKDSDEVINFTTKFQKLREWIDDEPECLIELSATDNSVKELCQEVNFSSHFLTMNQNRGREHYTNPVDPKFITIWRDFEERYSQPLAHIFLTDIFPDIEKGNNQTPINEIQWENADEEAKEQVNVFETPLYFAWDQADEEANEYPEDFAQSIKDGLIAWDNLKKDTGFDLHGILRRRQLIPFILIPRHVDAKYGSSDKLSLLQHLRQAHDAFIFGVPIAAVSLMRSILEVTVRDHYKAEGKKLYHRIENCDSLPMGAGKPALHRLRDLANDLVHFDKESKRLPENFDSKEFEKELASFFLVLKNLIEEAPDR